MRMRNYSCNSKCPLLNPLSTESGEDQEGNSLFRKFTIPKPYTSVQDVFCLRERRMVNGYRRVTLFGHLIEIPNVPLREDIDLHLVPDEAKQLMHIRVWWNQHMVHSLSLPLDGFRVHF
jgi:hypothetical protein